jgi:hypothetical protein
MVNPVSAWGRFSKGKPTLNKKINRSFRYLWKTL